MMTFKFNGHQILLIASALVSGILLISDTGREVPLPKKGRLLGDRVIVYPFITEARFPDSLFSVYWRGKEIFSPTKAAKLPMPTIKIPEPILEDLVLPAFKPCSLSIYAQGIQPLYLRQKSQTELTNLYLTDLKSISMPEFQIRPDLRNEKLREYDEVQFIGGEKKVGTVVRELPNGIIFWDKDKNLQSFISSDKILKIDKAQTYEQHYKQSSASLRESDYIQRFDLAKWCIEKGMVEEAKKELQLIIKTKSDHFEAIDQLAKLYTDEYKFENALDLYYGHLESVRFEHRKYELYYKIGEILSTIGLYESAIEAYDKSFSPAFPVGRLQQGKLLYKISQYEGALEIFKELLTNFGSVGNIARDSYAYSALCKLTRGNIQDAGADVASALKLDPTNPQALNAQGVIKCINKDYNSACEQFYKATVNDQFYIEPWINLAIIYIHHSKVNEARDLIALAQERDPENQQLKGLLALCEVLDSNNKKALESIEQIQKTKKNDVYSGYVSGWIYYVEKQFERSQDVLLKSLKNEVAFAPLYYLAGICLLETGKYHQSEALLRESVSLTQYSIDSLLALVILYLETGKIKEANKIFESNIQGRATNNPNLEQMIAYIDAYRILNDQDIEVIARMKKALDSFSKSAEHGYEDAKIAKEQITDWLKTFVRLDEKFNRPDSENVGAGWFESDYPGVFSISVEKERCKFSGKRTRRENIEKVSWFISIEREIPGDDFHSFEATFSVQKIENAMFGMAVYFTQAGQGPRNGIHIGLDKNLQPAIIYSDDKRFRETNLINVQRINVTLGESFRLKLQRVGQSATLNLYDPEKQAWTQIAQGLQLMPGKSFKVSLFAKAGFDAEYTFYVDDIRVLERKTLE